MDNIQTMNLSNDNEGMVPLEQKIPEKNILADNKENTMDSTPLDDVMGLNDMSNAPLPQDPRMMPPTAPQQAAAMPQQMMMAPQQQPQQPVQTVQSKNPLNLTDDQMEALFVGVVAVLAFSKPVQEKMAQMIPRFMGEDGSRSTVGFILSGLVAALVYFFGRRFVMKN